ncbi:MAG TPA: hypothetical protein PK872_04590 [Ferruginibacter sp.]|nr:hypothetical protein [Chitinophagaceae bacterium]MBK8774161.1 hypothetical protein [Chitinophagaceae bacterium]HRB30772.1 hypothetical protein [Ferruginibacter sp.]
MQYWRCSATEKIGNEKYKTRIQKLFIDDYNGMTLFINSYYFKNKFKAGCTIKGQRIGFENSTDTIFINGIITIDNKNNELVCREYFSNGYQNFLHKDSLVKIF